MPDRGKNVQRRRFRCAECQRPVDERFADFELQREFPEACFDCRFWLAIHEELSERPCAHVVTEGLICYSLGEEPPAKGSRRGFGGAGFFFENIETGELRRSRNCWLRGKVPERFHDRIRPTHRMLFN